MGMNLQSIEKVDKQLHMHVYKDRLTIQRTYLHSCSKAKGNIQLPNRFLLLCTKNVTKGRQVCSIPGEMAR